jgi:hypothetical protein
MRPGSIVSTSSTVCTGSAVTGCSAALKRPGGLAAWCRTTNSEPGYEAGICARSVRSAANPPAEVPITTVSRCGGDWGCAGGGDTGCMLKKDLELRSIHDAQHMPKGGQDSRLAAHACLNVLSTGRFRGKAQ